MKFIVLLAAAAALLPAASAHYVFGNLIVGDEYTNTYQYVRKNSNSNSPLLDVTSDDIRCNTGAQASAASTGIYNVSAGSTVGFGVSFGGTVIHPGPLQVYMSKAPDGQTAATYDGSGDWFKIYEEGTSAINSTAMSWYTDGGANFTWTLPAQIPSGDYLMRVEHIALHQAETYPGAQFYVECAQLHVTGGSGTAAPTPTVKIPGVYTGQEPGIAINIYYPIPSCYPFPGPTVWPADAAGASKGGCNVTSPGSATGSPPSPPAAPICSDDDDGASPTTGQPAGTPPAAPTCSDDDDGASPTTSQPAGTPPPAPVTSQPAATTAPASPAQGAAQSMYGQCGGSNWTGPTACVAGAACSVQNPYYSQCLPVAAGHSATGAAKARRNMVGGV